MMFMQKFQILEHTADLKIQAFGENLPEVFVNLARGMTSQQLGVAERCSAFDAKLALLLQKEKWEKIALEAQDLSALLIDWLNEILYLGDVKQKVYLEFEILQFSEAPYKIKAKMRGVPCKQKILEVKAATYHNLIVRKNNNHFEATVIFDI